MSRHARRRVEGARVVRAQRSARCRPPRGGGSSTPSTSSTGAPARRPRALANDRAYAVGFVLARPAELLAVDPFFPAFIAGVEAELSARQASLVLQVVPDLDAELEAYRRSPPTTCRRCHRRRPARRRSPPGVLAASACPPSRSDAPRAARRCPAVVLDDVPAWSPPSSTSPTSVTSASPSSAVPRPFLHARNRREAWRSTARSGSDCATTSLSTVTSAARAARRRPPGCSTPPRHGPADRHRLRQRPDGGRRASPNRPHRSTCARRRVRRRLRRHRRRRPHAPGADDGDAGRHGMGTGRRAAPCSTSSRMDSPTTWNYRPPRLVVRESTAEPADATKPPRG